MKRMIRELWDKNRTIISDGVEESLEYIKSRIPINIYKAKSGTKCFDWTVPKKWNLNDAYIELNGERIIDTKDNILYVLIGSGSVDRKMKVKELVNYIYTNGANPISIPYMYEHYDNEKWGFCLPYHVTQKLMQLDENTELHVKIDSTHEDGELLIGEYVHRGECPDSIALFSHLDHPTQVQDGLSGCALLVEFTENILREIIKDNYYTYRIIFFAETIGSLAYFSMFPKRMEDIKYGCCLEMVGVPNQELVVQDAFIPNTEISTAFTVAMRDVIGVEEPLEDYRSVVVNDDGIFNSPGIEIPTLSLSRSASRDIIESVHFKGYHTSADDINNICWENMYETMGVLTHAINIMEFNRLIKRKYTAIPHLSAHGLWVSRQQDPVLNAKIKDILDMLRDHEDISVLDIANKTGVKFDSVVKFIGAMEQRGLVKLKRKFKSYRGGVINV